MRAPALAYLYDGHIAGDLVWNIDVGYSRRRGRKTEQMNIRCFAIPLILTLGSATFGAGVRGSTERKSDGKGKPEVLYVWAGDQAHQAPDFLAVIDFD